MCKRQFHAEQDRKRSMKPDPLESEDSAGYSDFLADWLFIVAVLLGAAALAFYLVPIFNPAWGLL